MRKRKKMKKYGRKLVASFGFKFFWISRDSIIDAHKIVCQVYP